jgi:hypothetical protein
MTFLYRAAILLFLLSNFSVISAQKSESGSDKVYGLDPALYNGRRYIFFLPANTTGNQFLEGPIFEKGGVKIRGVIYNELELNFDIFNQQLILQYKDNIGAVNLLIVSDAWLESFNLRGLNFELIPSQDTSNRIFQVLGTGRYRILYHWKKELNLESFQGSQNHMFSDPKREMNLQSGNQILKFWNNKSYYSLFESDTRIAIKGYLRKNKIKVKKSSDQIMTGLINYCNSLYSK